MSAPSIEHEDNRRNLDELLIMAGLRLELPMPWWLRPDVARVSLQLGVAAIGDAKATECPGNPQTLRRLIKYARAGRQLSDLGWNVVLCMASNQSAIDGWSRELATASRIAGLRVVDISSKELDVRTSVTWLSTSHRMRLDEPKVFV